MRFTSWLSLFASRLNCFRRYGGIRKRPQFASWGAACEPRVLFSGSGGGTSDTGPAKNDTLTVQWSAPVKINVLANDIGSLEITALTGVYGGTASIIEDGSNPDQVLFTPAPNFVGTAYFTYTTVDTTGATDTANVSVGVLSSGSSLETGENGQLIAKGGIGGTGYQASTKAGFTPGVQGNYQVITSDAGQYSRETTIGDAPQPALGTQALSRTTTSTFIDTNNWSFIETVVWNYDVSASDGLGNSSHTWGGYSYTLSVTTVSGVKVTSFTYGKDANYDITVFTDTPTFTYTNQGLGTSTYDLFVTNTSDPTGPDSGGQTETETSQASTIGTGTFWYATSGGSVSGTMAGSSSDSSFSTSAVVWSESSLGVWTGLGTAGANGNGSNSFTWTGAGSYGDANFSGIISDDSGGDGSGYSYSSTGVMLADFSWAMTGTGTSNTWSNRNFAYNGTGTYFSAENGVTRTGTNEANGNSNSLSNGTTAYAIVAGKWEEVSGAASGGDSSFDHWGYNGTGTYVTNAAGTAMSGTINEDGHNDSSSNSNWSRTRTTSGWQTTGTGSTGANGHAHFDYNGTGTFTTGASSGSMTGTVNENGFNDSNYNQSESWGINSKGEWELLGGSGLDSGGDFSHRDYNGSGSYSMSGTDAQFGNWSVSGTRSIDGMHEGGSSWEKISAVSGGEWAVTGGTSSGSGANKANSSDNGSGSYSYDDGVTSLSGTLTHSASNGEGGDWTSESTLVLSATSGSGESWELTSGSANHSSSGNSTFNFIVSSGTYSYAVAGGAVTGTATGYGYRTSTSDSESKESVVAGKWELVSGEANSSFTSGDGASYTGGGGFSQNGDLLENGTDVGDWSFGGTITESGNTTDGTGWYSKHEVVGGTWVETDYGGTASGSFDESYSWDGTGAYTRGVFSGTTERGGESSISDFYSAKNSVTTGVSGQAGATKGNKSYSGYEESGTVTISGATGLYEQEAHDKSSSQESVSFTLDPATGKYEATSGSSSDISHHDDRYSFSGNSATVTYDFGVSNKSDSSGDWTLNTGTEEWDRTAGTSSQNRSEWSHYSSNTSAAYTTANGVTGTQTTKQSTNYDYAGNTKSTFSGSSWSTTGSGTEDYSTDSFSGYSASGGIPGGTYSESGHSHQFNSGHIDHNLTASGWVLTGSGSGGGDSAATKSEDSTTSWTSGTVSGSTTTKSSLNRDSNYTFESELANGKWKFTSGDGTGHADESYDTNSSGSGAYTVTFANGQGTASGTQNSDSHYRWGYTYDETYTLDVASQTWSNDGSGSGSADAHGHSDYSAKGSYGSSSNGGSLDVSGSTGSQWDAKWDWDTKGNSKAEKNWSGSSLADSTEKSWHSSKTTTTLVAPYVGTTTSESSGSSETKSHSESLDGGKKNWQTDSTGSSWWSESNGGGSGYVEKTSQGDSKYTWNWTLTEPNHTRTESGYSSFGSYVHEKDTWNHSYSGKASSDGSSDYTYSSGGSHNKDWTYSGSYSMSWTETWTYGGMSGSGSGGGYSNSTSGGTTGTWSGSGSESSDWSGTWSIIVPANTGSGSGSGGGGGGGGGGGNNGGGNNGGGGGSGFQVAPPINGGNAPTPAPAKGADLEKLQSAVDDLMSKSGLSNSPSDLYTYHDDKADFDCDDFADASAHYLRHKLANQGFTDFDIDFTYIDPDVGDAHLMVVVEQDGKYILIDPQSGVVTAVLDTQAAVAQAMFAIMIDKTSYNSGGGFDGATYSGSTFLWFEDRDAIQAYWSVEGPPWHTDEEMRTKLDDFLRNQGVNPSAFYPDGKGPALPATFPAGAFFEGFLDSMTLGFGN